MIEVLEYKNEYEKIVRDLLIQLQEYLVETDDRKIKTMTEEYREKYLDHIIKLVEDNEGKIILASFNEEIVGMIVGFVKPLSIEDKLKTTCPKIGKISKLVVDRTSRGGGIGKILIKEMEEYLKETGCQYISLDVSGYNTSAMNLYNEKGYSPRLLDLIKKV
ncbi:MAG: GNAT family N-acetyltransferase [Bacilli bacterium]|nr:GNAT family N-acetyltransferase [Bacilli bacterium]